MSTIDLVTDRAVMQAHLILQGWVPFKYKFVQWSRGLMNEDRGAYLAYKGAVISRDLNVMRQFGHVIEWANINDTDFWRLARYVGTYSYSDRSE